MRFEDAPPPAVGSSWRQTRMPSRVAKVLRVDRQSDTHWYVWISGPWMKNGRQGRSMEVFLKQYDPVRDRDVE